MDAEEVACISEYGLELLLPEEVYPKSTPANVRWMAPEVISTEKEDERVTLDDRKRADVYSLAMVMFEVRPPYLRSQF